SEFIGENRYAIAHDVFGGIFALTKSGIVYFAPDSLQWENLEISYDGFIEWISTKDLNEFYESFLWDNSGEFFENVAIESGVLVYPFFWAKEYEANSAVKKIVPYQELLEINWDYAKQFEGRD
ncbi:MAG: DUF2625 family protein, partial [Coriobacteriales bacterium]|nr:DUF2625 family protein [Coriobacteriales bacterium]